MATRLVAATAAGRGDVPLAEAQAGRGDAADRAGAPAGRRAARPRAPAWRRSRRQRQPQLHRDDDHLAGELRTSTPSGGGLASRPCGRPARPCAGCPVRGAASASPAAVGFLAAAGLGRARGARFAASAFCSAAAAAFVAGAPAPPRVALFPCLRPPPPASSRSAVLGPSERPGAPHASAIVMRRPRPAPSAARGGDSFHGEPHNIGAFPGYNGDLSAGPARAFFVR